MFNNFEKTCIAILIIATLQVQMNSASAALSSADSGGRTSVKVEPSPAPGPSPTAESVVIPNGSRAESILNSDTVQTARSVEQGLANTGLIGAALQTGRHIYPFARYAITLWLLK